MTNEEIIIYIVCFICFVLWTALIFFITYKVSYKKGYNDGVDVGTRRLNRQRRITNFNNARNDFRKRRYIYE